MDTQETPGNVGFATQSEQELTEASRGGDAAAYAELWRRTHRLVYSVTRARSAFDADDIVAAAYAAVWEQFLKGGGPRVAFKAYVVQVARNLATRAFLAAARTITDDEIEPDPVEDTGARVVRFEEQSDVMLAFQQLPENWQQALWWSEVEGLSCAEIGQRLGLSPNGVSALTRRAREGLRLALLHVQLPHESATTHPSFVAHFPKLLRGSLPARAERDLTLHLDACAECSLLENELRAHNPNLVQAAAATTSANAFRLAS